MGGVSAGQVERRLTPCSVLVVGSSNTDYVLAGIARLPQLGETVLVQGPKVSFQVTPGGKSANASIASSRYFSGRNDGTVCLIASVGKDENGRNALQNCEREGVFAALSKQSVEEASGVALILVTHLGENAILVAPGANSILTPDDFQGHAADGQGNVRLEELRTASVVLMQLEIPMDTVRWVADALFTPPLPALGPLLLLNLAPLGADVTEAMLEALFAHSPIIIVNELECKQLMKTLLASNPEEMSLALSLAEQGEWRGCQTRVMERAPSLRALIVTLGAAGACALHRFGARIASESSASTETSTSRTTLEWLHEPAELLPDFGPVVDTTGAGDCFCGVLAAALAEELAKRCQQTARPMKSSPTTGVVGLDATEFGRAFRFATAAATLSVTRKGAQQSFPKREEVERFIRQLQNRPAASSVPAQSTASPFGYTALH